MDDYGNIIEACDGWGGDEFEVSTATYGGFWCNNSMAHLQDI